MTTDQIVWTALGTLLLILIGVAAYLLKADRERINREIAELREYARTRLHALSNIVSGMVGRVEHRDDLHQLREDLKEDMRDMENRLNKRETK